MTTLFQLIHLPIHLIEHEENSRTSSFKGPSDVAQKVAQEPIFHYSGQVNFGGPFKAFYAKGESLGPETLYRRLPRDHK